jgi:hypothetical protein
MSLLFFGLAIAAVLCMGHAATRKRWEVVRGGVPIAAALLVVALIFQAL